MTRKRGHVFYQNRLAGILEQGDGEFIYSYDSTYLTTDDARPVSLSLPLRTTPYRSAVLFAFFDGLIPEGWLLDIAVKNWKLNAKDRMSILLALCHDCIGAVHILPVTAKASTR